MDTPDTKTIAGVEADRHLTPRPVSREHPQCLSLNSFNSALEE